MILLEDFDAWVKVRFLIDDNGEVSSVSIPIEPEVDNLVFQRKRPELDEDVVAALLGVYDPPVEGLAFTITAHAGKIYAAQTGNPPQELTLY